VKKAAAGPPHIPDLEFIRVLSTSGGYGDVYLYREVPLERDVAVKVLREGTLDAAARQRFQTEATTMARLHHPNVVAIHAVGTTRDDLAYIVMAYCPDQTLAERATGRGLSLAQVLTAGVEIGGALHSAHLAGIIHRDVKPANILTLPWGASGLTDFGVATHLVVDPDADDDDVGVSIPWSPPEMLFTATRGSVATDVYSLAATVWHLLVGRSPFELPGGDNSRLAVMSRIRDSPPPPTGRADVPSSLERVLARGLAKNPAQRYASAEAFARALGVVEEEARLPRSRLVVTTHQDRSPALSGPAPDEVAKTRIRALGPDRGRGPVVGATARPEPASGSTSLQHSRPLGADGPGRTVDGSSLRRRSQDLESPAPSVPQPSRAQPDRVEARQGSGRRSALLVACAVGVLAAAGAYLTWHRGDEASHPAPTVSDTVTPGLGNDAGALPPGTVEIEGKRDGNQLAFTWDYAGLLETDTYRWRTDDGRDGVTDEPRLELTATGRVCLEVLVVRESGASTQAYSSPRCTD